MSTIKGLRCPVCRAKFRGTVTCSRCGADLNPMMHAAAKAWHLRQQALSACISGDNAAAAQLVQRAQKLHNTDRGRKLDALLSVLNRLSRTDSKDHR